MLSGLAKLRAEVGDDGASAAGSRAEQARPLRRALTKLPP